MFEYFVRRCYLCSTTVLRCPVEFLLRTHVHQLHSVIPNLMVVVEHGGEGWAARVAVKSSSDGWCNVTVAGDGHLAVGGWGDCKVRGAVSSVGGVGGGGLPEAEGEATTDG
jgi:hypothetical protein